MATNCRGCPPRPCAVWARGSAVRASAPALFALPARAAGRPPSLATPPPSPPRIARTEYNTAQTYRIPRAPEWGEGRRGAPCSHGSRGGSGVRERGRCCEAARQRGSRRVGRAGRHHSWRWSFAVRPRRMSTPRPAAPHPPRMAGGRSPIRQMRADDMTRPGASALKLRAAVRGAAEASGTGFPRGIPNRREP